MTLSSGSVAVLGAGSTWRRIKVTGLSLENPKLDIWQKQVGLFEIIVSFSTDSRYVRYVKTYCLFAK